MSEIIFVTGNEGKAAELQAIIGDQVKIRHVKIDLPEIQGSAEQIVIQKLETAVEQLPDKNLLIEDSSLEFRALGGLPGPYIKWFLESMTLTDIVKMLDSFEDKTAIARATFGLVYQGKYYILDGKINGQIIAPVGQLGFGWDAIFKPDDSDLTFGQMSAVVKNDYSPRGQALQKLLNLINN